MIKICHQMKEDIGLVLFNTINYYLNKVIVKTLIKPLSANFTKWSNTLKQFVGNLPTNFLSVFGHFVGQALKVKHRHEKKLVNLRQHKRKLYGKSNTLFIGSTVHNYSSYNLTIEEEKALSFGLDQHIPTTLNRNNLHTQFKYIYPNIINDISHL